MPEIKTDRHPEALEGRPTILIGIDCGVNTGFAVWCKQEKKFLAVQTLPIHKAIMHIATLHREGIYTIKVIVEDARQVRFKTKAAAAQGAGSVKRDATIWQDFLKDYGIPHEMVRPQKALTNYTAEQFAKYTGYTARTSTHARDAAMLVFKRTN